MLQGGIVACAVRKGISPNSGDQAGYAPRNDLCRSALVQVEVLPNVVLVRVDVLHPAIERLVEAVWVKRVKN